MHALVSAISALFTQFVPYWFAIEEGLCPRLLYTPNRLTPLVIGVDELGELRRARTGDRWQVGAAF